MVEHLLGGRDYMNRNLYCLASSFRALLNKNSFEFKTFFLLYLVFPHLKTSSAFLFKFLEVKQEYFAFWRYHTIYYFNDNLMVSWRTGYKRCFELSLKWYFRFPKGNCYGVSLQPDKWECVLEWQAEYFNERRFPILVGQLNHCWWLWIINEHLWKMTIWIQLLQ